MRREDDRRMRGGRGSTFVVEGAWLEDSSYQMEMLRKNRPMGLLPVQMCAINEKYEYYYDAGSGVRLSEYLDKRTIDSGMFRWFTDSVKKVLFSIEEYLLEINCLCMEPEHIYVEEKGAECVLQFCYGPMVQTGFEKGLLKLLQFFLEKLDYDDREGVTMAYQMYQNVMKEGYLSVFSSQIIEHAEPTEEVERLQQASGMQQSEELHQSERLQKSDRLQQSARWQDEEQSWKAQRTEESQVVFPWEEEGKEKADVMEKAVIYGLGIIICGLAAGFCYWQGSLVLCGIVLLLTAVILYGLIRYGRRDKGIDSVENTW